MGVYLLGVSPVIITPLGPFDVEFRVLNTGLAPIELPVYPHLADLQPADESRPFSYYSIALVISVEGDWRHPALAVAELYGTTDHEGTMLTLQPGEWVHVKAKLKCRYSPGETPTTLLVGNFWLRRNTFTPLPGGDFVMSENLYPNVTPTPPIPVHIVVRREPLKQ